MTSINIRFSHSEVPNVIQANSTKTDVKGKDTVWIEACLIGVCEQNGSNFRGSPKCSIIKRILAGKRPEKKERTSTIYNIIQEMHP